MSIVGDAIVHTCNPLGINYDILGNTDQFLHGHIFPRYEWEKKERVKKPVWLYNESNWHENEKFYDGFKHREIRQRITDYLKNYMNKMDSILESDKTKR